MKLKTTLALAASAFATIAAAVTFGTMSLIGQGTFAGADGSRADLNLNVPLEPQAVNMRMGVVDVYSPKGALLFSVRPMTVEAAKWDGPYASIQGIASVRTAKTFVKAPYSISVYNADEDTGVEADLFEIRLDSFRSPLSFSGQATKGDIAFVPSK